MKKIVTKFTNEMDRKGERLQEKKVRSCTDFFDMELAEKVTDPVNRVNICVLKNKIRGFTFEVRNIKKTYIILLLFENKNLHVYIQIFLFLKKSKNLPC